MASEAKSMEPLGLSRSKNDHTKMMEWLLMDAPNVSSVEATDMGNTQLQFLWFELVLAFQLVIARLC